MQQLSRSGKAGEFAQPLVLAVAVDEITGDGVTDGFEVNADLVGAAGMEGGFDEGGGVEAFEDAKIGMGGASGAIGDGHPFAVGGMPGDGGDDRSMVGYDLAADQRAIDFIDLA